MATSSTSRGFLHWSFVKPVLEVVETPHPDDLTFHHLAGINPPLIQQAVILFSVQMWQEGDLVHVVIQGEFVDTCRTIAAVDIQNRTTTIEIDANAENDLAGQHCFLTSHLWYVHSCGNSVKVFAGPDKGAEGFFIAIGDNLTVAVCWDGVNVEVSPKHWNGFQD